jgi:predicted transcriptional regulator
MELPQKIGFIVNQAQAGQAANLSFEELKSGDDYVLVNRELFVKNAVEYYFALEDIKKEIVKRGNSQ